jgi:hypothetical protein
MQSFNSKIVQRENTEHFIPNNSPRKPNTPSRGKKYNLNMNH